MFLSPDAPYSLDAPPLEWKDWHRATFLGGHIEKQRRFVDDVLAVEALHTRIRRDLDDYARHEEEVLQALHLEHFFRCERKVYWPLSVSARDNISPRAAGVPDRADDLSALLQQLGGNRSSVGVVLRTPAGAGKTVATRKAFHDCLLPQCGSAAAAPPPLWGFLPCWLAFGKDIERIRQAQEDYEKATDSEARTNVIENLADKTITCDVVLEILARACRQPPPHTDLVRAWLEAGPKLLLFADLTSIRNRPTRAIAVKALSHFQEDYGEYGHRCVISCRDTPAEALEEEVFTPDLFQTYDLLPIGRDVAKAYLENIEAFVQDCYNRLADRLPQGRLQAPAPKSPEQMQKLLDLVDWQDRRGRGGHLLCTPLFMHLISQLNPDTEVQTLAQLYTCVVWERLRKKRTLPKRAITALTRAALVMQPIRETGVVDDRLKEAWKDPRGDAAGDPPDWWPKRHDSYDWLTAPYYKDSFGEAAQEKTVRYGLLRESDTVAGSSAAGSRVNLHFIHDSFIDYFVGAWALGRADGPKAGEVGRLADGWFPATAARLHECPAAWRDAAFFLGGVLTEKQVQRLLAHMVPLEPVKHWPVVAAFLLHGAPRQVESHCLARLRAAVRRAAALKWPEALFSLCYHAVRDTEPEADSKRFREEAQRNRNRPWLQMTEVVGRPLPSSQDIDTVVHLHHGSVETLGLSADGTRVVALSRGVVRCWDRKTGEVFDLVPGWHVTAFAMLVGDGRIALGCADGRVALVMPAEGKQPDTLYRTDSAVTALAVRPRQTELVVSHANGKVVCVAVAENGRRAAVPPRFLRAPRLRMRHLWALPDGAVVAGGEDGTIAWMNEEGSPISTLHPWAIVQLVALENGEVLFADVTGTICRLRRGDAEAKVVGRSPRPIRGLGTTADGTVVYVNAAGVHANRPLGPALGRAEPSGRLAWTGKGELVVGDEVGTVQVWPQLADSATSAAAPVVKVGGSEELSFACAGREVWIIRAAGDSGQREIVRRHLHSHPITCLLARAGRNRVVTGTHHGEVAIWDAASGQLLRALQTVRGTVTALDFFDAETDTFLCGDSEGTVVLVSPRNGPRLVGQLGSRVNCVRTLGPLLALVGCENGKVYRVRPASAEEEVILPDGAAVIDIVDRPDACWIVGHSNGRLRVLDRNGANPRPLSGGGLTGGRSLCCLVAGPTRDCSWFVVGDGDGRLWFGDEGSGKVALLASEGAHYHFGAVKHLAANPDGTLLASAAADRIVLLWDIPNRRLLDAYEAGDIVTAVAWLSAECLAVGLGHGNAAFLRLCRGSAPAAASSLTPLTS